MTTIRLDIDPQSGDLEDAPVHMCGNGAVCHAGDVIPDSRGIQTPHHLFGWKNSGHIDIDNGAFEQRVAHTASHEQDRGVGGIRTDQRRKNCLRCRIGHPVLNGYLGCRRHHDVARPSWS